MYVTLAKRLYGLLYCTNPAFFPSSNKSFIDLFEKELNILSYLEKTEAKKHDLGTMFLTASLIKKYNSLTNRNFVLSKKNFLVKGNKLEDLNDDINYLAVFCKNIFKVNVDSITGGVLHSKSKSGVVFSAPKQENVNQNHIYGKTINSNFSSVVNESYIYGLATSKAMNDLSLGKIYAYKTKPRIILILKIILLVLLGLSCLLSLVLVIVSMILKDIPYNDQFNNSNDLLWVGICFMIYALICANAFWSFYHQLNVKNLNLKYSFPWTIIIPYLFFTLSIVIFDLVKLIFFVPWYQTETIKNVAQLEYIGYQIVHFGVIVLFVLSLATVVCFIIGVIFKPQKDEQIIKSTIDKYVDELSKSQPPFAA